MNENVTEPKQEVAETATISETVATNEVETTTDVVKDIPKTTARRRTKKSEPVEVATQLVELVLEETTTDNKHTELEAMKAELEAMKAEKAKLEEERKVLNDTVAKLQEEVKITPQKLGIAIQQMGIAPMTVGRDKGNTMTLEAYNSMTDTARRDWQRTHRTEYLEMMHNVKLR